MIDIDIIELVRFYPDDNKDTIRIKRQRVAQMLAASRVKLIKLGYDWWFVKESGNGEEK